MAVYSQNSGMVPWNPEYFGAAYDINNPILPPKQDPYSFGPQPYPAQRPVPPPPQIQKQQEETKRMANKIAYLTTSRKALIAAVVILSILFAGALTGALLLAFPNALLKTIDIKVASTRTDLTYTGDASTATLVENTMCNQVKIVASSAANIEYCKVTSLEDASPGVKANMVLKTQLDGKDPSQVVAAVGEAIVRAAAVDATWNVAPTDISVQLPGYIPPRAMSS